MAEIMTLGASEGAGRMLFLEEDAEYTEGGDTDEGLSNQPEDDEDDQKNE